ncbi:hypothetical protein BHM03_00028455, partial [Ensete ventricosum]
MATSRDVQEIVSKLSSDKAKAREEGVKLLSSWLEGERAAGFCKLLGHNTAKIKADSIPHEEPRFAISYHTGVSINCRYSMYRAILSCTEHTDTCFGRNEGKILRKLMECLNTYLLRDGPNLGNQAVEIHFSVQDIMFRCWFTTHDQGLKLAIFSLLLLDYVAINFRNDISREDKLGTLGSIQQCLMELAATVFYQAL